MNQPVKQSSTDLHAPAANTAAVITLAAAGGGFSRPISQVIFSCNATATGGRVTITGGGTTIFDADVATPAAASVMATSVLGDVFRGGSNVIPRSPVAATSGKLNVRHFVS